MTDAPKKKAVGVPVGRKDQLVPSFMLARCANTSDYEAGLRDLGATTTPTGPDLFTADLRRVGLNLINLIHLQESGPRIAFLSLPVCWRYLFFVIERGPLLHWNGELLPDGDIMLTGEGERLHQRTSGSCSIGAIGIQESLLRHYASGLIEQPLPLLSEATIINLRSSQRQKLQRLHARICQAVEAHPSTILQPEANRGIEQELIEVLVTCLVNSDARVTSPDGRKTGRLLACLEDLLAKQSDDLPSTKDICAALDISESVLESYCAASFDMTPEQYAVLRRAEHRSRVEQP